MIGNAEPETAFTNHPMEEMQMAMSEQSAVALVCEFIRRGDIHLPCLDKFESARKKELQFFLANEERRYDWSLDDFRKALAGEAARLDAEYLNTLIDALKNGADTKLDTGNFCTGLRHLEKAVTGNPHG